MNSGSFSSLLLPWFDLNKRDLPWRNTRDPYLIWLSEVILQQTRVDQGMSYYQKITTSYPSVQDLAEASEQDVLNHWQGLGYYSRARNLHAAAKMVVSDFAGVFPSRFDELTRLPGVGPYTAGAVASISSDQPVPVVDGNVYRVLSRAFGISTPINSGPGQKEFLKLASELLHQKKAGDYNQALMELGALVCKPTSPLCSSCPLNGQCHAREKGVINELPVKLSKKASKKVWLHYFVITDDDHVLLRQRTSKGIWQNLFDFPGLESEHEIAPKEVMDQMRQVHGVPAGHKPMVRLFELQHILTHRKILATFYHLQGSTEENLSENLLRVPIEKLGDYPIPKLIENFWERWMEESPATSSAGSKNA